MFLLMTVVSCGLDIWGENGSPDDGISVVIVTHEMSFARDTADEIIFMENGCIIEQGEARKVIDAPEKERTREFIWGSGR